MFRCLLEETYELRDAILNEDIPNICEELGDVLFQLAFIIEIYQEKDQFRFSRVVETVSEKMIRRHPHVYKDATIETETQLFAAWDRIKKTEKRSAGKLTPESILDDIPSGMPAMSRAWQVSKAAVKAGFDWDDIQGVLNTLREEIQEFEAAYQQGDAGDILLELGDIFFTLVNVARFAKIYPETALAAATSKFEHRFKIMEHRLKEKKKNLDCLTREEIDRLWEEAKQTL
jgi:MazG family protein